MNFDTALALVANLQLYLYQLVISVFLHSASFYFYIAVIFFILYVLFFRRR